MEEAFYSFDEATRIVTLTPGRIRQMLRAGELEGIPPEESGGRGPGREWKVPMHAFLDRDRAARVERSPEAPVASERLSDLEVEVRESLDTSSASHAGASRSLRRPRAPCAMHWSGRGSERRSCRLNLTALDCRGGSECSVPELTQHELETAKMYQDTFKHLATFSSGAILVASSVVAAFFKNPDYLWVLLLRGGAFLIGAAFATVGLFFTVCLTAPVET